MVRVSFGAAGFVLMQCTLATLLKQEKSDLRLSDAEFRSRVSRIYKIKMHSPERVNEKKNNKKKSHSLDVF